MSLDRRIGTDRVVVDDVLFERKVGRHDRACCICDLVIPAGEGRYIPVRRDERKKLVDGRRTRLCLTCVAGRIAAARGAA
jgi:hypothetical protein